MSDPDALYASHQPHTSMVSILEDAGLINNKNLTFEIYFTMDAVVNYQDSITHLMVYTNPLLHNFTDVPYMYNPYKEDVIVIEVRLTSGNISYQ